MNVLHIAWRELRATFHTAVGWLVLCGFLLVNGVLWVAMVSNYVLAAQDLVFNPYAGSMLSLTDHLLAPFFGNMAMVLLFITPALSMRLFAEEYKQRTMELLFTSPVSSAEIVLGKFLGVLGFVGVLLLCTLHFPASVVAWGDPDLGVIAGMYLAMLLMSGALLALGMLFSALTSNQIVALVLSFTTGLALFVVAWTSDDPEGPLAQISLLVHLQDLLRGALRLSDLAYFVLFTGVSLFATHQRLESFRWS